MHLFFTLILELFLFSLFNLFMDLFKAPKIEKIVLNMTDKNYSEKQQTYNPCYEFTRNFLRAKAETSGFSCYFQGKFVFP